MTEAVSLIRPSRVSVSPTVMLRDFGPAKSNAYSRRGQDSLSASGKADEQNITRPRDAKSKCREYIATRYTFQYKTTDTAVEASSLENRLKPGLNP